MDSTRLQKRKGYIVIGAVGLLFSAGYLGMSIQLPLGGIARPGAGVFPIVVGVLLAFTSLAAMWEGWCTSSEEHVELPAGRDGKRLMVLIGALLLYILALPWLGQIVSSSLFLILLMRVLTDVGWSRIIAYALAISLSLYGVFVLVLNVPMPRGILDF